MIWHLIALVVCVALAKSGQAIIESVPSMASMPVSIVPAVVARPTGWLSIPSWRAIRQLGWTEVTTLGDDHMRTVVVGRMPCGHYSSFRFGKKVVFVGRPEEAAAVESGARAAMAACSCKAVQS